MPPTPRHPNLIGYYRSRCEPPLTQAALARALGVHLNTVQSWEKHGVPAPNDLLRLTSLLVAHRALPDYPAALAFWQVSGRESYDPPPELRALFALQTTPPDLEPSAPRPLPQLSFMPLRRNHLFIGRDDVLSDLSGALAPYGATVAICGLAGLGKSQLACEFAHRSGYLFPGGVFWINCAAQDTVAVSIAACGGPGHLDLHPNFEVLSLERQVQLVLSAWRAPVNRLLIFDNCEDEAVLAAWRPSSGGCRVLVTSRRSYWDPTLVTHAVPLPVLQRDASVALLARYLAIPTDERPTTTEVLGKIADVLGSLPLALHLAGTYIASRSPDLTPERYLAELQTAAEHGRTLLQHASLQRDGSSPTLRGQHVAQAFAISCAQLQLDNPVDALARRLLARAAYFALGEPLPRSLVLASAGVDDDAAEASAALARLVGELGLLERGMETTLRIHPLIAVFVRAMVIDDAAEADVENVLADAASRLEQESEAGSAVFLRHLQVCAAAAQRRADARAIALNNGLGWQLYMARSFDRAQAVLRWALDIQRGDPQADLRTICKTLELLALVCDMVGDRAEAQALYEEVLAVRERVLGPDHLETADICNNLGYFIAFHGSLYERARHYLERAVDIRRRIPGLSSGDTARSLRNLGYAYYRLGRYRAARRYLRLALRIFEAMPESYQIARAQTLMHLGEVLLAEGQPAEAQALFEQMLALRVANRPPGDSEIAESYWYLGRAAFAQQDYQQAHADFAEAEARYAALPSPNQYVIVRLLSDQGRLALAQGDLVQAEAYLQRAEALWAIESPDHIDRVGTLVALSELAHADGAPERAAEYAAQALQRCMAVLGPAHPLTVQVRHLCGG